MSERASAMTQVRISIWPVMLIAGVQLALHLWVNAHDQFFRDELYYLAAGQRLDLGYVDFPPLVAAAAAFSRGVLGSSLVAIRLLPALAGSLLVLVAAAITAELGGGAIAQTLAALAVALGPVFLGTSGILTMDPFDELWWAIAAWIIVRLINRQQPRLWLVFGLVAGIAMLTKITFAFFAFAVIVGLLLTRERHLLFNRWLLFGAGIALLVASPYPIWQVLHGFPTLDFWRNYASGKTFPVTPIEFLGQQILTTGPLSLPLWLAGLYFLFFTRVGKPYRCLGWAYLILYVLFMLTRAKFYFLSPTYPILFASGATQLDRFARARHGWQWLSPVYLGLIAIAGIITIPLSIPLLSPEGFLRYNAALGGPGSVKTERLTEGALPQNFADRYGWPEMTAAVARAYQSLPAAERASACILTSNYGEAGAVDFYGPAYGLPKAISGHNSYYLWGPGSCDGKVIITVNLPASDLIPSFASVESAGETDCRYCMPYEAHAPILIARGLKVDIRTAWPTVKNFN